MRDERFIRAVQIGSEWLRQKEMTKWKSRKSIGIVL